MGELRSFEIRIVILLLGEQQVEMEVKGHFPSAFRSSSPTGGRRRDMVGHVSRGVRESSLFWGQAGTTPAAFYFYMSASYRFSSMSSNW